MELYESIRSLFKLHSLLVNKLNHTEVTPLKEAMMKGIEETLLKAELGFQAQKTE